jgi:hypothetical protein
MISIAEFSPSMTDSNWRIEAAWRQNRLQLPEPAAVMKYHIGIVAAQWHRAESGCNGT